MKRRLSKKTNRLISILCLGVFCLSISMLGIMVGKICKIYFENQELNQKYEAIKEEAERIEQIYNNVDDEGFYNVYGNGDMIIYGENEIIIIPR